MKAVFIATVLFLALPHVVRTSEAPGQRVVKVQKTSLTKDEETQLGEQAAARAERHFKVIEDTDVEEWLRGVGAKLSAVPQAGAYSYQFKLVQDDRVNAVAFPGGLVYVNTGLLTAAANESEVAGVLAHEMSHVALRHGAANETKTRHLKTALQVAGIAASVAGVPVAGPAIGLGGEAGARAVTSKYSRDSERDADLNGARMMAAAGYNPEAIALLLEKLSKSGASTKSKPWEHLGADHPDTAKRAQWIREDIHFYPAKTYDAESGRFPEIRTAVGQLTASSRQPVAGPESSPAGTKTAGTETVGSR